MKILFINLPYHGHVVPTIGLVQELLKQGCEVTYLMPFDWEGKVAESGAVFAGYENHRQLSEQIKNAYDMGEKIIDDFDMVIYEQFFFLGKHLAEKHGKPAVRIFTAPATNKKLMNEYISSGGPLGVFRWKWLTKAFTKDIIKGKGITLKTDNWLDEIIENPPELNLVYTLREYQPYVEDFSKECFKFLGPSVYARKSDPIDFAKSNRPVIYISLGTIIKGDTAFFQNCIEAFRGEDVDVIVSVGQKFDIRKLRKVPDNIHIYPSVPQVDVLEFADVFVTHGGMNSVSESLVKGTPMVVIPFVSDQPVNATQIETLGLGKRLEYKQITSENLKQIVFSVLHDEQIASNMKKTQELIANAPGNTGGAQMIIAFYKKCWGITEEYANDIQCRKPHYEYLIENRHDNRFTQITETNKSDLEKILNGKILFTPGHTADSVSLKIGDMIFCGDAAMNGIPSMNRFIIWIENIKEFENSWNVMISEKSEMIYPAHGKPFDVNDLKKYKHEISKIKLYKLK